MTQQGDCERLLTGYFVKYRSENLLSFSHSVEKLHGGRGNLQHKQEIKVKVCVYNPDIPRRFSGFYSIYPEVLELTLSQSHLPGQNAVQMSATVAIHAVQIFTPPGTHYC